MEELAGLSEDARKLAMERFRLLRPHLENNEPPPPLGVLVPPVRLGRRRSAGSVRTAGEQRAVSVRHSGSDAELDRVSSRSLEEP